MRSGGEVRGMAYKLGWTIAMTMLGLAAAAAVFVVADSIRWGAWLGTLAPAWS
jgi:hypothetical protein